MQKETIKRTNQWKKRYLSGLTNLILLPFLFVPCIDNRSQNRPTNFRFNLPLLLLLLFWIDKKICFKKQKIYLIALLFAPIMYSFLQSFLLPHLVLFFSSPSLFKVQYSLISPFIFSSLLTPLMSPLSSIVYSPYLIHSSTLLHITSLLSLHIHLLLSHFSYFIFHFSFLLFCSFTLNIISYFLSHTTYFLSSYAPPSTDKTQLLTKYVVLVPSFFS